MFYAYYIHVGKNVRVKLEKKSLFPASSILCCFGSVALFRRSISPKVR